MGRLFLNRVCLCAAFEAEKDECFPGSFVRDEVKIPNRTMNKPKGKQLKWYDNVILNV